MKYTMLSVVAVAAFVGSAQAITPFVEEFNYTDGDLTTVSGGLWGAHSGAGNRPIQVTGGTAQWSQGPSSGEDLNRSFGPALGAGETVYAGFDLKITDTQAPSTDYIAHFKTSGTFFQARLFQNAPQGGGDYSLGLSYSSNLGDGSVWSGDFAFGDWNRIVIAYEYDTGNNYMWVNGVGPLTVTGGFSSDPMEQFALRQDTSGNGVNMIDNIRVADNFTDANVPTPGAIALFGLAGLCGVRRRRA